MRLRLILSVFFRVRIWTGQGCQKCRVFRESMENPVLFLLLQERISSQQGCVPLEGRLPVGAAPGRGNTERGSENTKRWGKSHGIGFGFVHAHKKHDEIVRFL